MIDESYFQPEVSEKTPFYASPFQWNINMTKTKDRTQYKLQVHP
jgi:hypothetical protein